MKFHAPAGVTHETLVMNARNNLRSTQPEAYKLFLLCLCGGLRRTEADVCLWSHLNPEDCPIRIESSEFIEPKHGSGGTVYVDASLMKELMSFKGETQNGFIVNSTLKWKPTSYGCYRCEPHWRTLIDWLEDNGISARKKDPRTPETCWRCHRQAERHLRRQRPTPSLDYSNDRQPLHRPTPARGPPNRRFVLRRSHTDYAQPEASA